MLIDPYCQFWSVMIHVLLLQEGNYLEKNGGLLVILQCFCNNLQLISYSFTNFITYLVQLEVNYQ
jgi:hypothetical protein